MNVSLRPYMGGLSELQAELHRREVPMTTMQSIASIHETMSDQALAKVVALVYIENGEKPYSNSVMDDIWQDCNRRVQLLDTLYGIDDAKAEYQNRILALLPADPQPKDETPPLVVDFTALRTRIADPPFVPRARSA